MAQFDSRFGNIRDGLCVVKFDKEALHWTINHMVDRSCKSDVIRR